MARNFFMSISWTWLIRSPNIGLLHPDMQARDRAPMTGLRSYGDPCGIARALDVVGERWALLIVRELLFGPKRFTDLRAALGASPNVLSQRLGELESSGVVERRNAGGALYELSDWGRQLHPILLELGRWGVRSLHRPIG